MRCPIKLIVCCAIGYWVQRWVWNLEQPRLRICGQIKRVAGLARRLNEVLGSQVMYVPAETVFQNSHRAFTAIMGSFSGSKKKWLKLLRVIISKNCRKSQNLSEAIAPAR